MGPDEISGHFLKETSAVTASLLQTIFQCSLDTGETPQDWREANVAPLFKKGERYKPSNYRPVSVTSIASKVLEHNILVLNIMKNLEGNGILYDLQHGFRKNRSCESQLLQLVRDLAQGINSSGQTDMAILDFSKAFDVVPHRRLLYKLQWYRIGGNANAWIKSFLSNRHQRVVVDGVSSSEVPVTSGVPQGSVLGPVLFLVYINDLPDCIQNSTVKLFADDCILHRRVTTWEDVRLLQQDLDALQNWESTWLMKFNAAKCSSMSVTLATKHKINSRYTLHNTILEVEDHSKYLGVTIQSNLQWDKHIQEKCAKAHRTLGLVQRNIRTSNRTVREQAYKSLVRPQVEYASTVWSPWHSKYKDQIEKVQRRAARYVCRDYGRMSSVTSMLNDLSWESLESRRTKARLIMMYKGVHGLVEVPIAQYVTFITPELQRGMSHDWKIYKPYSRVDVVKYSFIPCTITLWNGLPPEVIGSATLEAFKSGLASLKF